MPRASRDPFDAGLKQYFVKEYARCGSFSQHKVCVVHPQAAEAMASQGMVLEGMAAAPTSADHEPFSSGPGLGLSLDGSTHALHKHAQVSCT